MAYSVRLLTFAIYLIESVCIVINVYVLLNRSDTIYYLRIYHLGVGMLMVSSAILQLNFMRKGHKGIIKPLLHPCSIPRHTTVSAMVLTAGIVLGYAYFIVFDVAFSNCDKLIDAKDQGELMEDAGANVMMIFFCIITLIYIWQRSFYGPLPTCGDILMRHWVNMVLTVVWVQIVVFKGYLSYQELCQRKELSGYWCPVIERPYECDPEKQLKGTQKIWYYLHKGLLNSTIISCASEFFPVLLVAHWIACGGGKKNQQKEENGEKMEESELPKIILTDSSTSSSSFPSIDGSTNGKDIPIGGIPNWHFILLSLLSAFAVSVNWFVDFYVSIQFDWMHQQRSMLDDYADFGASMAHLLLFSTVHIKFLQWARRRIPSERWDLNQKAKSRGDSVLILGSVIFMTIKLVLQLMELQFQRADGILYWGEALFQSSSLIIIQASQWVQVLCLRNVLCFHEKDLISMRHFLPFVSASAVAVNAVDFGTTFFETNTIKYQLTLDEHHFSQNTLLSMIFTQTIYPADYLFCFTAAGCWMDVLLRYSEMGLFRPGKVAKQNEFEGKNGPNEGKKCENDDGNDNGIGHSANWPVIYVSTNHNNNMTQIVMP